MSIRVHEGKGSRTSIVSQGRKKLHTTYADGSEMVEEYDVHTHELLVRKHRFRSALKNTEGWEYEIGEAPKSFSPDSDLLAPSCNNPVCSRKDTPSHFCWRIRNLPYPVHVYSLELDNSDPVPQIVVRTSNKKYFKRIRVTEMSGEELEENALNWEYGSRTMVIQYKKPPAVVKAEQELKAELATIKSTSSKQDEAPVDCKTQ